MKISNAWTEITCDNCGKKRMKQTRDFKKTSRSFCNLICYGLFLAKTRKGIPRPEVRGEKPHLQKRVDITCVQCGKIFQTKQSHKDRRKFCSRQCMTNFQKQSVAGENNFNWKGGYDPYYGPNWRPQRNKARTRDNYTCQRCGINEKSLGRHLDVHHKEPFRTFGLERYREANSLENLISLCYICHTTVEHNGL